MSGQTFGIVLSGAVLEGFDRRAVVRDLSARLKITPHHAEQMLLGQPTPLKQSFDRTNVQRVRQRLLAMGVECRIVVLKPTPSATAPAVHRKADATAETAESAESPIHATAHTTTVPGNPPLPFGLKVVIACLVVLALLCVLSWRVFQFAAPYWVVLINLAIYGGIGWALLRAYRVGWFVAVLALSNQFIESCAWIQPGQPAKWLLIGNMIAACIALICLWLPGNLRRLQISVFDRLLDVFGGYAYRMVMVGLLGGMIFAVNQSHHSTGDRLAAEKIRNGIIDVSMHVPEFLRDEDYWEWPVGAQLPDEDPAMIARAEFKEGNVVDIQFTDQVRENASISLVFSGDGQLLSCATDTIPGRLINPDCYNCTCNASSSTVR